MAAVYLIASLGVMPSPALLARWVGNATEGIERYPCEDHACGCISAHECWTHCCCHTPHQRLVWAITHGVKPPADVHFSSGEWLAAASDAQAGTHELCVCDVKDRLDRGIATGRVSEEAEKPSGLTISALACKGIQQILATSVPPAAPPSLGQLIGPVAASSISAPGEQRSDSRALEVRPPPPRLG